MSCADEGYNAIPNLIQILVLLSSLNVMSCQVTEEIFQGGLRENITKDHQFVPVRFNELFF